MEKIKNVFKSTSSRNGSYSVGLIALVIGIVIVINLIAGQLPESVRNIDISSNQIYEISDTSREILADLDTPVTFTVYAEKNSADERIRTFIDKYAALSKEISVEWVDPVLHPSALTENDVSENDIVISCAATGRSRVVSFSDILVVDSYYYYYYGSTEPTEFDGEGQLTSAVSYVTSGESKKICYTSGHGEETFSDSVLNLFAKNNLTEEEVNLLMDGAVPEDCDLLFIYAPEADLADQELEMIENYMAKGGEVFLILRVMSTDAPNLDALLSTYGMSRVNAYIADMQRYYEGNPFYIAPVITGGEEFTQGLSTYTILLVEPAGLTLTDPERESITVEDFMTTSSDGYAVTETTEEQGTYVLGAVATETLSEDTEDEDAAAEDVDTSRLTVITADSLIDSGVTDYFSTVENLDLFMNAVSAGFTDMDNVAIEAKSLSITYNTMQYTGLISLLLIIGVPLLIVIFGFMQWWRRRRA